MRAQGGGRLAQPNLKILDKNANPKAKKELRRNLSINGLPLLTHSCTDCIPVDEEKKWGNRAEEKKRDTRRHLHERRAGGGGGGGARPAEPNKAGPPLGAQNPEMGGQAQQHPPLPRGSWRPLGTVSQCRMEAWALSLGISEGFV